MVAIGIQKPDVGNILAVRPDVPLVKGLGPVLNIILAYSKCDFLEHLQPSPSLTISSWPCRILLLPSRAQRPARLQEGPLLRTGYRRHFLHDHLRGHLLLRRPTRRQSRARFRQSPRHEDCFRHRPSYNHRRWCRQRLSRLQVHLRQDLERHERCAPEGLQEHGQLVWHLYGCLDRELAAG